MHRLEMLHQDVRPENVMLLEPADTLKVKLIDYRSTAVRGLVELNPKHADVPLGVLASLAPEYFIGRSPSVKSDQFSLAVMSFIILFLTQQLPYGTDLARCKTEKALKQVRYHPLLSINRICHMAWTQSLKKRFPFARSSAMKHFQPLYMIWNTQISNLKNQFHALCLKKHPVTFWKSCTAILFLLLLWVFALYFSQWK